MKIKPNDTMIRIACVLCAIVLWVIVMIEKNPKLDKDIMNVPVTVKNLDTLDSSDLSLINLTDGSMTINVKVTGYKEELAKVNNKNIIAYIDVLGYKEGTNKGVIEVQVPNSVDIKDYSPKSVNCDVQAVISKNIEVAIEFEGNQADGYYIANATSNPSIVAIRGPRSVINSAEKAVATVPITMANDAVVKSVPISILSDTGTVLSVGKNPSNVEVSIPIYPTKVVNIKPNITGEPLVGYKQVGVSVEPKTVTIAANQEVLDSITELELETLDITDKYHNIMQPQKIINDSSVIITSTNQKPVVNVSIEKIIQNDFVYMLKDMEFINVPDGYKVDLSNTDFTLVVTARGVTSVMNQFIKSDLKVTIDLKNAVLGLNQVKPIITTSKELETMTPNSEMVEINLIDTKDDGGNIEIPENNDDATKPEAEPVKPVE